MIALQGTR